MVTDQTFQALHDRKDQQVDSLLGRNRQATAPPDSYQEALRQHAVAESNARMKQQVNLPERGPRPPMPQVARPSWDITLYQDIGGVVLSTPLALELKRLVETAGIDNVLAGLSELGYIAGYGHPDS